MQVLRGRQDAPRLTMSLGESLGVRAVVKPITFPAKIWGSVKIVQAFKRGQT
jgi:hypothetical protein